MVKRKDLANIITITRIITTTIMCITSINTTPYIIAYIYAGLSDVLDGIIARSMHIVSDLGRKLDSIADLYFYSVLMIKIWPYLIANINVYLKLIIIIIVIIRILLYVYVRLKKHEMMANHTYLNKITGVLLFVLPFTIKTSYFIRYSSIVTFVALIAAIYECLYVLKEIKDE